MQPSPAQELWDKFPLEQTPVPNPVATPTPTYDFNIIVPTREPPPVVAKDDNVNIIYYTPVALIALIAIAMGFIKLFELRTDKRIKEEFLMPEPTKIQKTIVMSDNELDVTLKMRFPTNDREILSEMLVPILRAVMLSTTASSMVIEQPLIKEPGKQQ